MTGTETPLNVQRKAQAQAAEAAQEEQRATQQSENTTHSAKRGSDGFWRVKQASRRGLSKADGGRAKNNRPGWGGK